MKIYEELERRAIYMDQLDPSDWSRALPEREVPSCAVWDFRSRRPNTNNSVRLGRAESLLDGEPAGWVFRVLSNRAYDYLQRWMKQNGKRLPVIRDLIDEDQIDEDYDDDWLGIRFLDIEEYNDGWAHSPADVAETLRMAAADARKGVKV